MSAYYEHPRDHDDTTNIPWAPGRVQWTPTYGAVEQFPDVPDHIAAAVTEATLCHSVGAYRAVGGLARAVVEATAKEPGARGSDRSKRIENLTNVSKHTKEQAHEVRHFGNEMAHGDFAEDITAEEATEALTLMKAILRAVYQEPRQLARLRAAREARRGTAA